MQSAQNKFPGRKRLLYPDIDGHRNQKGAFDLQMDFLLSDSLLSFIMNYLTENTHSLLGRVKGTTGQKNVIPDYYQFDNSNS